MNQQHHILCVTEFGDDTILWILVNETVDYNCCMHDDQNVLIINIINNFIKELDALTDQINKCNCENDLWTEWMTGKNWKGWSPCFNCKSVYIVYKKKDKLVLWIVLLMCMVTAFTEWNHDPALINTHQVTV